MHARRRMIIENPYATGQGGNWLRGNLHTHTTASDGRQPIQEVVKAYAHHGYDFLMISDHDLLTGPGEYAQLDAHGLMLIAGNEITAGGPHLLHVNAERRVEPNPDRQVVIDAIKAGAGFAVMNHPNWLADFNHCSFEQLATWQGYLGLEIYNGTIHRLNGSPYATDKWDRLLSAGRRVWGFANDDSHLPVADVALGWNMVWTGERSVAAVLEAFRRGSFYASTGVKITGITVADTRIRIETADADCIVAVRQEGQEIAQADARILEIEVPAGSRYVRFECLGHGRKAAWTQPFHIRAGTP